MKRRTRVIGVSTLILIFLISINSRATYVMCVIYPCVEASKPLTFYIFFCLVPSNFTRSHSVPPNGTPKLHRVIRRKLPRGLPGRTGVRQLTHVLCNCQFALCIIYKSNFCYHCGYNLYAI
jgi:hypothetical protein